MSLLKQAKLTVSKTGTPTQAIADKIAAIESDIAKIEAYCLEKDGNIDQAYINGQITITKKDIGLLTAEVKKLQSDLSAQSCPGTTCDPGYTISPIDCGCNCNLDCQRGNVYNWRKCICSPYADIDTAYDCRNNLSTLIKRTYEDFTDSTKVTEFIDKMTKFQEKQNALIGECEYNFENQTLTEVSTQIKTYEIEYQKILKEYEDYVASSSVCTTRQCDAPTLLVKGCTCADTPETAKYYEVRDAFLTVEDKIRTFSGNDPKGEYPKYVTESNEIRKLITAYRDYLVNNPGKYDKTECDRMTAEIKKRTDALNKDFDAWNEKNNPTFSCKLTCSAANNEALDERKCECVIIPNLNKLPGVSNQLPSFRDRIKKLNTNDNARQTFNDNV